MTRRSCGAAVEVLAVAGAVEDLTVVVGAVEDLGAGAGAVELLGCLQISLSMVGLQLCLLYFSCSVRSSSSKRDYDVAKPPRKLDLDGLTPFEKNFYVESPSVAAMSEKEVEEY
ncbi:hypothetical protein Q3G72_030785 [Acer saccharum]|nr:hypothetical protein Q3G72_030785 [Acer saccharum]